MDAIASAFLAIEINHTQTKRFEMIRVQYRFVAKTNVDKLLVV